MCDDEWNDDPAPASAAPPQRNGGFYKQDRDNDDGDDGGDRGGRGDGRGRGRGGYRGGRGEGRGGRGGGRNFGDRDGEDNDEEGGGGGRGGGRGRGRGGFRGGRGGQGGGGGGGGEDGDNDNGGGEGGEEEPKKERYCPEALLEGDDLIRERTELYTGSGINFDAYASIPVKKSENCTANVANSFSEMGLRSLILGNVEKMGYKTPLPIQKHASPILMMKQDVMACAQTGSGKTAAFLLPIINTLMADSDLPCSGDFPVQPSALILAPTRELAIQIDKEAHIYSSGSILRCVCLYGGTAIFHQKGQLGRGCHILVATPGRLKQFLEERHIDLSMLKFFVLDEADRMLDMGFMPDVKTIVEKMPPKGDRVAALFSATFPQEIQIAARDFLNDYVFVVIGIVGGACADVEQVFYKVERKEKREKVSEILGETNSDDKILIFCNSKKGCDFLAAYLSGKQISSTSIHGDRLQSQRELALREFTTGKRKVLVATAVAARGLDIPKVTMVINYDLPPENQVDEYIHRIGRTGRVGHTGKAVSFFEEEQDAGIAAKLVPILKGAGQKVPDFFDEDAGGACGGEDFGATDHRASGSAPKTVEAGDDDWE